MLSILKSIKKHFFSYKPLIEVKIMEQNLLHNFLEFQKAAPNLSLAPVLKSNAYGHGLKEVSGILKKTIYPFLIVDSLYEALELKKYGNTREVLVIGFVFPEQIQKAVYKNISFAITSLSQLEALVGLKHLVKVHLKVDTGMYRQGLSLEEADQAVAILKNNPYLKLEGLCSHLADADGGEENFTLKQIEIWNSLVEKFKINFKEIKYFHVSATAGFRFQSKIQANVLRLGLGFYGINPSGLSLNLKPALELQSYVVGIKQLKKGDSVGYNHTFTASKDMQIAVLPLGYFEGVDRRLSNLGYVKINDKECSILGRVSMNITSCDVTEVLNVNFLDPVTVISSNPSDRNSVENIAKICQTIPYEILVHIPQHLRRMVI